VGVIAHPLCHHQLASTTAISNPSGPCPVAERPSESNPPCRSQPTSAPCPQTRVFARFGSADDRAAIRDWELQRLQSSHLAGIATLVSCRFPRRYKHEQPHARRHTANEPARPNLACNVEQHAPVALPRAGLKKIAMRQHHIDTNIRKTTQ